MECVKKFFSVHKGILSTIALSVISLFLVFYFLLPRFVNDMGGTHSWLSGSTIKFVNYWLDEGAANLNFTNYEAPASIEYGSLEERTPYLSYPTGETFFVYMAAKILGKSQISVSFLHKFQWAMFFIEAVLLSCFVYFFLSRTVKIRKEVIKRIISVLTAVFWAFLPVCTYYLINVYYADQCVILWIMVMLLVEYLIRTSRKENNWLKVIRAMVIFSGLLIDYYFWILAALLFVMEIWSALITNKKGERKKKIISIMLWFGVPTILALSVFYIQLIQTNGWFDIMTKKFTMRVVGRKNDTLDSELNMIATNFTRAFSRDGVMIAYLLCFFIAITLLSFIVLLRRKKLKSLITEPGISIVFTSILAVVVQIFFLKQHSAIHEFSMIKVGWVVAFLPILASLAIIYALKTGPNDSIMFLGKKSNVLGLVFLPCFLTTCLMVGIPGSTYNYINIRIEKVDYSFEQMIKDNTDFNDVLFSFSKEIVLNPPQSLAISKKQIYKIEHVSELNEMFPELPVNARKVLVVDKEAGLVDELYSQEKCLVKQGSLRVEMGDYILYDLKNINKCIKESDEKEK